MKFVWGFACIVFVVISITIFVSVNFLAVDSIYALLPGSIVGTLFLVISLFHDGNVDTAIRLLFFSLVGSIVGFIIAWSIALLIGLNLISNAALVFDLITGVIGSTVLATLLFKR